MSVSLPALPRGTRFDPELVEAGGVLRSALGGPDQALLRFGDKLRIAYVLPTQSAACAKTWVAAQMGAKAAGDTLRAFVPQVGVGPTGVTGAGSAGSISVTATGAGGVAVGQWFSFVTGGVSYLHLVTANDGGDLTVAPRLRAGLSGSMEFAAPVIEGFLDAAPTWSVERLRFVGLSFSITEAR